MPIKSVDVDKCLQEVDSEDDDGDEEKAVYVTSQIPFLPYINKRLESQFSDSVTPAGC